MKIKMLVELAYSSSDWYSTDKDRFWFFEEVLKDPNEPLILHSNDVGDQIGEIKILEILEK